MTREGGQTGFSEEPFDGDAATAYLKTLGHRGRLLIVCHLMNGEKSVGELERLLNIRQAAVSQMLARLRDEGQVVTRREGKTVYYRICDADTERLVALLSEKFGRVWST
ncbi:ArsR/SmtB family transcription factor [Roseivivax isoporae]|uniref:ArsR family transcriptional regulator n=1 Tax=Roseivivax isoporae LMG 25204 TaxID=1449351 RepID=X7FD94_9RHOB|nr:metalloregulator ArsR/SmtB family transcription factor [Roseivivax isoporae]ETX30892.1 ArsR family transcriptional regulator [Roseivivax isoporae LMG 25204]